MKRTRIAVLSCTAVLCFALLVGAIWAAVVATFGINTKLTFNPNGVYVELSGQIYRGASYSELGPLLDDPTYTLETCKNYTTDETGTPTAYSTPQWAANEVLFLPTEKVIQFKLNVTNKGDKQISVVPTNDVTITGVTVTEEASDTLAIPAGETREYRITLTAGTTALKSVPFELNLDIVNTEDITNPESDFTMDTTTATELKMLNSGYQNPVYSDNRILVVPNKIGGNNVLTLSDQWDVDAWTFSNLKDTRYVVLPETLTYIGNCSFSNTKLVGVGIPCHVTTIDVAAFIQCKLLTSIAIPDGVTKIDQNAFYECESLVSVTISKSVTDIGAGVFSGCGVLSITVDEANVNYSSLRGSLYDKNQTSLIRGAAKEIVNDIPNSVTTIGASAFNGCKLLSSIVIPNSVTTIYGSEFYPAFGGCTSLTSITIPSSVTSIGQSAFSGCTSLETMSIPFAGGSAAESTFLGYIFGASSKKDYHLEEETSVPSSLKNVIVTGGTSIPSYAFAGCKSLVSIVIPDTIQTIGEYAFGGCTSLTGFVIPNSVETLGYGTFCDCTSLTSIIVPSSIKTITHAIAAVFGGCTSLTLFIIDSQTMLSDEYENRYITQYANIIYVKTGLTVPSATTEWSIRNKFTKQSSSDKVGYDKWVKNS